MTPLVRGLISELTARLTNHPTKGVNVMPDITLSLTDKDRRLLGGAR